MTRSEALQPLSHDHHEGLVFAARLRQRLGDGDRGAMAREVEAFWEAHLVPHFQEEERLVLPILREGAPALAERMLLEHEAIEALVRAVASGEASVLRDFADALKAHIRFEEREAFPAAERLADEGDEAGA